MSRFRWRSDLDDVEDGRRSGGKGRRLVIEVREDFSVESPRKLGVMRDVPELSYTWRWTSMCED